MGCRGDLITLQNGTDFTNGIVLIVIEISFDGLDFRFGKKNRFSLAIEEKTGGIAAFPGIVLDTQFPRCNYVSAPAIQSDGTDRFPAEHPGRAEDQIFVQRKGSADMA